MDEEFNVPVGTRVQVKGLHDEDLGLGTYERVVPRREAAAEAEKRDSGSPANDDQEIADAISDLVDLQREPVPQPDEAGDDLMTAVIKLDSGETIFGFECFWISVDD